VSPNRSQIVAASTTKGDRLSGASPRRVPSDAMATASPGSTPNPNALKFTLDVTLPEMMNVPSPADAATPFQVAVMAAPGVASLFGVNDFVTVTRVEGADWEPIVAAVVEAAKEHL
jgi:hypothetical protein